LQTLSAVQSQLRDLEDENSISRRRVRELEMELEECKRHVARERTRLIERDELNDLVGYGKTTQTILNKGKGRAVEPSVDIDYEQRCTCSTLDVAIFAIRANKSRVLVAIWTEICRSASWNLSERL
jgi:hypothetical protein